MLFYDPLFLTAFPILLAIYLAVANGAAMKWVLLVGSLLFYAWGEPVFVPILMVSTFVDHQLSRHLSPTSHDQPRKMTRNLLLGFGITTNLAILFFYKYADFVVGNFNSGLGAVGLHAIPLLSISLPIGVSFVVFEKITYLVDTYRGISQPASRFSDYGLFVLFFPKLLAGPILKYHEMEGQIAAPRPPGWEDLWTGFTRFARGAFKKLLIADPVGACADQIFAVDPTTLHTGHAWLGVVCFTLQIYFDFSGYTDMAIGIARMLGFRLRENFNMPYIARSLTDFWQRWHISLTTWIRDYLYVPLGGNRLGTWTTYRNLWICFLLSGLWHGASWNFVLWGAYNGMFLTLDRIFLRKALQRSGTLFATGATLLIVMIGWVIFRSPTPAHLGGYLAALFGFTSSATEIQIAQETIVTIGLGAALVLFPATPLYSSLLRWWQDRGWVVGLANAGYVAIYVLALSRAVAAPFQPFIYFRF